MSDTKETSTKKRVFSSIDEMLEEISPHLAEEWRRDQARISRRVSNWIAIRFIVLRSKITAALRFDESQATAAVTFTAMNLMACLYQRDNAPWWLWVGAGVFWPAIAFAINLTNPFRDDYES